MQATVVESQESQEIMDVEVSPVQGRHEGRDHGEEVEDMIREEELIRSQMAQQQEDFERERWNDPHSPI